MNYSEPQNYLFAVFYQTFFILYLYILSPIMRIPATINLGLRELVYQIVVIAGSHPACTTVSEEQYPYDCQQYDY